MKKLFTFLFLICMFMSGFSQWKPTVMQGERLRSASVKEEFFSLDIKQLQAQLANAQESGNFAKPVVISIPVLGGKVERFNVYSAPVMVKELAAQYQLGSYAGVGIDDPTKIIRFSVAPNDFQSMIMKSGQYEFIEPANKSKTVYRVFPKTINTGNKSFVCSTMENPKIQKQIEQLYDSGKSFANNPSDFSKNSDKKYRTLRLALSVTGEYTGLYGGTVAGALVQMNASLTRVNGVYEKDFALRLILQNYPNIIYTNSATDPYSPPSGMNNWNLELQQTLTAQVGNANYDIGHLFGHTGGGGNAGCIGCICVNPVASTDTEKGSGYTSPGSGLPQGDTFDIDYVAHEMGHQLGGTHTFSHALEGAGSNMEPGSGSTIMGYAGITSQNVQMNSDPYFHAKSIDQIQINLISKTCDIETAITANNPPVIAALTPYSIPKGTAFVLTASATDPEADPMTYTWEQYDNASTPITSTNIGNTTSGAAFRSMLPTASPTRYFPRLSSVLAGVLNNSNGLWEAVPTVARTMNFRVTVRDNHTPLNQQQTQYGAQTITVGNDGPFIVTSTAGFNNTPGAVTWNVVNTTNAPYNVANVKIDYTTDNGATWTTLAASTPNDGTEDLVFAGVPSNTNVIVRVSALNNVFYAVKTMNITASALCTGAPPTGINITGVTTNQATVNWTAIAGATYVLQYSVVGSGTWTTISNITGTTQVLNTLTPGANYQVQVASVCSGTQGAFSSSVNFTTIGPSSLPYLQPFTSGNDFVFIGTQTNKWFYGAAAGNPANAIYISNDNGVTNAYNNSSSSVAHAYKDLIIPAGSTIADFKFDWKSNGQDTNWDFLRVWLVPATFTPTAGTQITAGGGRIQIGGNFQDVTTWQTYSNPGLNISTFAGQTMRLVFEWKNDGVIGTNPPAAVDNVNIFIPTCLFPINPSVALTPNSATLSWTAPIPVPANGYQYYVSTTNTPPSSTTAGTPVTGTSVTVPATPGTTYYWWVRAICSATDASSWVQGPDFTPGQIGSGTATTGNLPVYSCFGYNYSQQIYTAAEVGAAIGTNTVIKKIRFYVASPAGTQSNYNDWVVYMGNTTQGTFATTTSWVPSSQLMQVYSGTLPNMVAGTWVELTLNVPFVWDGTSNIVIAVDENSPDWSCTAQWGGYTAGANRGILYYSDGTNPTPQTPPTASSRYSVIPRIQLVSEPMPPCTSAAPTYLNVSGLTTTSAFISWMPAQGATYVLQWRPVTTPASAWSPNIPLTTSYYLLSPPLSEQTTYEVRVAYVCSGVQGAYTTPLQFTTPALSYCVAAPTSTTVDVYISNVTVNPVGAPAMVSNSTDGAQYIYYNSATNPSRLVKLVMGTSGNQISVSKSWPGTQWSAGVGVWIDWNRDGDFADAGEQIFTTPSNTTTPVGTAAAGFTVPLPPTAYTGPLKTRMRVVLRESATPTACGTFTWGEVEDYDVQLIQPVPCTATAPTNLAVSNLTPTSATLSWMPAQGATYIVQWREVTTPVASPWITVTPAPTNSATTITGLLEQHNYEFQVAYICSGVQGAWGGPMPFTTPPLIWCSAGSTSTPLNEHISNVTVTPSLLYFVQQPVMTNTSGASGYTDYYLDPAKRIKLIKGSQGNAISISKGWVGAQSNVAVSVWIDWNRDGDFSDPGEQILTSPANQTTPITGVINVPTAGLYTSPYPTKMRVIARLTTAPSACGTFNFGEVEDYALELIEPTPCNSAAPVVTTSNLTHNSVTLNWTTDPGGATYVVQYKPLGAAAWTAQIPLPSLSNTYTIVGMTPATQYVIEVIALCNNVPGPAASVPITTNCDPAPPTNFTVTQITSTTALVSWDPVATAVYVLQYREVGTGTWITVNVTGTNFTLTNLNPYTTYEVHVASQCSGAINPYTTPQVFTTLPTCEMAPVGLTISNLTMTSAQVDWNAISGASYVLRWRKVGASAWTTVNVATNTYIITGLTEETQYEVEVANVCNGAQQVFTHPYVFTTPGLVYCNMSAVSSSSEHISNVTVKPAGSTEQMSSDSGPSSYTSYLADPTRIIVLLQGSTGNQISVSKSWTGTQHKEAITVWIDFNRDGYFTNNERILIAPANTNTPITATFNVPSDAFASLTTNKYVVMRVAMRRDASPEMCSVFDNGEVEDYMVRIVMPVAGNIMDPNQIIIYPNPTKNTLYITRVEDGSKYKIYDSAGRIAQAGSIFANKIDVSNLINGVFMIDIEAKNGEKAQKKFIKE